ncbi:MAG: sulfotransferase domain-containing protein [Methylobacter sp.]|nr:sulfotransferase domain-containing protein [Methylobacter sp.]
MSGIYWLASYPKSGNTWFRVFLQNLLEDGDRPVDINKLATGRLASHRGWLDDVLGFDSADLDADEVERLRPEVYRWSSRDGEITYHKIHDAYIFTADDEPLVSREATRGALYILRNPLDVLSSFANHIGSSLDKAIACMEDQQHVLCESRKQLPDQVRQKLLSWSGHVLSWVDEPTLSCHVLRYEDMLVDPVAAFTGAVRFLGLPDDPVRIEKAIRFSDFEELAGQETEKSFCEQSPRAERFFRHGKSGIWRDRLSPEQIARIIADHGEVMRRFGYLDADGRPL